MRLFIGIDLAAAMLAEVNHFIRLFDQNNPSGNTGLKWTSPENLHFTLKFLGEVPLSRLNDLKPALSQAVSLNKTFPLQLGEVGCFPAKGIPRIIWLGVTGGEPQLIKLANSVENACFGYGFPKEERPFSPHLTIARLKGSSSGFKFFGPKFQFSSTTIVAEINLIESQLYPTGPVYRKVESFQLLS